MCEFTFGSICLRPCAHVCVVTLYACNVCVGPRASLSVLLVMCVLPAGSVCTRLRLEPRGGPDNTISVEPEPRGSIQRGG